MTRRRLEAVGLWVVAVIAVAAGWTGIVTRLGLDRINSGQAVFLSLCALASPALPTAMLTRHPTEPIGPLLGLALLMTMLAASRTADLGPVAPIAGVALLLTAPLPAVVVTRYSALTFPPRVVRLVTRCFWASASLGGVTTLVLVLGGSVPTAQWFTTSPGPVAGATGVLLVVHAALVCTGPLLVAGTGLFRPMPRASRDAARPIMWPATCWALALTASEVWRVASALGSATRDLSDGLDVTLFVILPAFLVGALAAGIGWTDVMVRIPTSTTGAPAPRPPTVDVEHYLARALADPSVRVRYPVDGEERWLSTTGRTIPTGTGTTDRATTVIIRGSHVIGLIDQDAATTAHPDAVELVATGAGLIMETERLRASAASDLERAVAGSAAARHLGRATSSPAHDPREGPVGRAGLDCSRPLEWHAHRGRRGSAHSRRRRGPGHLARRPLPVPGDRRAARLHGRPSGARSSIRSGHRDDHLSGSARRPGRDRRGDDGRGRAVPGDPHRRRAHQRRPRPGGGRRRTVSRHAERWTVVVPTGPGPQQP